MTDCWKNITPHRSPHPNDVKQDLDKLQLETGRLHLIPFTDQDVQLFWKMNCDPFIRKYLWDDQQIDVETTKEILHKNQEHFEANRFGIWKTITKDRLQIIGFTGLWYFFKEPQPQLIYALSKNYTGQGYAREAANAIIEYAFNTLHFGYVTAAMDEPHIHSQNVAIGLGMKLVDKRIENGKPTVFYRIENTATSKNQLNSDLTNAY